jgi:NAD(P)-dependent dehydrogenase (short-subunit alcohol dehydrogenase family)
VKDLCILVTGATRGLGSAICLEFAKAGASVVATHRWGSVSEAEFAEPFLRAGVAVPRLVESDAGNPEDTQELMASIREHEGRLDAVVSNVAFGKVARDLSDLKRPAFDLSFGYSSWPLVDLVTSARVALGRFPRYVIAVSSDGPDVCHPGYDVVAACKAVLETLCRYLALRLKEHGVRVNAIRPGFLDTESARQTFGSDTMDRIVRTCPDLMLDPASVAQVCLALCSGWMDSVTGQVLTVDGGWSLVSPIAYLTGETPRGPAERMEP